MERNVNKTRTILNVKVRHASFSLRPQNCSIKHSILYDRRAFSSLKEKNKQNHNRNIFINKIELKRKSYFFLCIKFRLNFDQKHSNRDFFLFLFFSIQIDTKHKRDRRKLFVYPIDFIAKV